MIQTKKAIVPEKNKSEMVSDDLYIEYGSENGFTKT